MKRVLVWSIVALAMGGGVEVASQRGATPGGPVRSDEDAIRSVIQAQGDAFNRKDAVGYLANYTPDADSVNGRGVWQKGRNEIVRGLSSAFESTYKEAKNTQHDVQIRFARPDVAIVHVLHELGPVTQPDGQKKPTQKYMATHVLIKEGGQWLETAVQHTVVQPTTSEPSGRDK